MTRHATHFRGTLRAFLPPLALCTIALFSVATLSCGGGSSVAPPPPPDQSPPPLQVGTNSIPDAIIGSSYAIGLSATGGTPPYSWSLATGSNPLPGGIRLTANGFLTGNAAGPEGTGQFQVQAQDSMNRITTKMLTLRVVTRLASTTAQDSVAGAVGFPFTLSLTASGGTPPYTWSAPASALPPGLQLSSNGVFSGTPTTFGPAQIFAQVADAGNPVQTAVYSALLLIFDRFTIFNNLSVPAVVNKAYQAVFQAVGGVTPFVWSLAPGSSPLPAGLNLGSDGSFSGVPQIVGNFSFHVQAQDSSSPPKIAVAHRGISVLPRLTAFPQTLSDGVQQQHYSRAIQVTGGLPPYLYRLASGSLPPGFSLVGNILGGMPTTAGQFAFDFEVTDSTSPPDTVVQTIQVRINSPLIFNAPAVLPDGLEGRPYSFSFMASGGVPPYGWNGGPPVPGVSIDATTGVFSGTPVRNYSNTFLVQVIDSANPGQIAFSSFIRLTIFGALGITSLLPPVTIGQPVRIVLATKGGVGPINTTLVSGNMPSGLSFDPSSLTISGTPVSTENQTFVLQVRDSGVSFPQMIQQSLTLSVVASAGRNDSMATATPLSSGRYAASLSPPDSTGGFQPDQDFYRVTAKAGAIISVETFAERLAPSAPTDTVIELLNSSGNRLTECGISGPFNFFLPCMNDDERSSNSLDSNLFWVVTGTPGTSVTFFVRVISYDGNARPDYRYEISITGAN